MGRREVGYFKQFAAAAVLGMLVSASAANAKTYVLTFTTKELKPPTKIFPGIPGVTKLTVTLYSSVPFPANFSGTWSATYNFSDGVDTLASLTDQGFTVDSKSPVLIYYLDSSGEKIVDWTISTFMTNETAGRIYGFTVPDGGKGNSSGVV